MLWLYARFSQLPLEVLAVDGMAAHPAAVFEGRSVLLANPAARRAGVDSGQSPTTARHLCPDLKTLPRAPDREQRRLQQLALWAYHFTPDVCLDPPDGLLLEVSGSLRLFRGFTRLHRIFLRSLRRRSPHTELGLGHTPLAARLLSHQSLPLPELVDAHGQPEQQALDRLLAALPVGLLPCDTGTREKLETMGLHTLGDVMALPRAALNKRFGPAFGKRLMQITGERPDPRERFAPPDTFSSERQFNGGVTNKEQLRFPLSAMLRELEQYLRIKQWINRRLQWTFHYSDGSREQLLMELSHRHFRHRNVLELVLLKLERITLRGPLDGLGLYCDRFEALDHDTGDLFDIPGLSAAEQCSRFSAVLDKLQTRLGSDCCFAPMPRDEHLPEQAWTAAPPQAGCDDESSTETPLRPLWLMESPRRIDEQSGQLYWHGGFELLQGPERIDNQWWRQRRARDYYIARHEDGGLYWLYRDCLSRCWYVHGIFS